MKKSLILLAFILFVLSLPLSAMHAQAASGVRISPLTFKYDVNPGSSVSGQILVMNENSSELSYTIEVENFSKVSDEGAPTFDARPTEAGITSLADWFVIAPEDKDGVVAVGDEKKVPFTINVPEGVEPGGHYAAIFVKEVKKSSTGKTELGVSSRVGSLVLVNVPGNVVKSSHISSFSWPKIVWRGPVEFSMSVINEGTTHFDSQAKIEIDPILGKNQLVNFNHGVDPESKSDQSIHTILPDNTRIFKGTWENKYPFGYYKINATATDIDGQPMTVSTILWAIPLIIVIPALILVAAIIVGFIYLRKHLRFVE